MADDALSHFDDTAGEYLPAVSIVDYPDTSIEHGAHSDRRDGDGAMLGRVLIYAVVIAAVAVALWRHAS